MDDGMVVRARRNDIVGPFIALYIARRQGEKHSRAYLSLDCMAMVDVPEGMMPPVTLLLDATAGQALMDDLWACGLRPAEGAGSAGALAATQRHLEDMRTMAFQKMGLLAPKEKE